MQNTSQKYYTLGLMSGTSLDGLDIAFCSFSLNKERWSYKIEKAFTIPYTADWREKLSNAQYLSPQQLQELDHAYGRWIGLKCIEFLETLTEKPDLIASHGHTIFHQPEKGYTLQIGNGNDIAAITGKPVVYDFRSLDIALGGKGAPLVPAGDELLFPEYDSCLNLGGFSNISYRKDNKRIAFDICPVNIAINYLANKMGHLYDKGGAIAKEGIIIDELLQKLNGQEFYNKQPPRTLMREWFETEFLPWLDNYSAFRDNAQTVPYDIQVNPENTQTIPYDIQTIPDNTQTTPDNTQTIPNNKQAGKDISWNVSNNILNIPKVRRTVPHNKQIIPDIMRTIYEHIAVQITNVLVLSKGEKILITGGGAKNTFLISLLNEKCKNKQQLIVPEPTLVDFKEALIFGFLGLLRKLEKTNCFCTVTGAERDCSTGVLAGI